MGGQVAMSPDGHVIATGAGARVWVARHEGREDPVAIHDVGGEIVGVAAASGGFLVLTSGGRVVRVDDHARRLGETALGAAGLAIDGDGPHGVALVAGGYVRIGAGPARPIVEIAGGRAVAVRADGAVAVGTADGRVHVFDPEDARVGAYNLGEASGVRGLASAPGAAGGLWLATAGERVYAVSADARTGEVVTRAAGRAPDHVAASRDGRVFAARIAADLVIALALPSRETAAQIRYFERTATGVALGGPMWLAIGLDEGDCNWVSLQDGAVWRSDPPSSEPRRSWTLAPGVFPDALVGAKRRHEGAIVGVGGVGIAAAGVAEDPADGNNRPATEEAPRPTPQDGDAQASPEGWWSRWSGWLGGR